LRIAKIKAPQLLSTTIDNAVKEVLGTCISIGVTVEGKDPRDVQQEVDAGMYEQLFGSQ